MRVEDEGGAGGDELIIFISHPHPHPSPLTPHPSPSR